MHNFNFIFLKLSDTLARLIMFQTLSFIPYAGSSLVCVRGVYTSFPCSLLCCSPKHGFKVSHSLALGGIVVDRL